MHSSTAGAGQALCTVNGRHNRRIQRQQIAHQGQSLLSTIASIAMILTASVRAFVRSIIAVIVPITKVTRRNASSVARAPTSIT